MFKICFLFPLFMLESNGFKLSNTNYISNTNFNTNSIMKNTRLNFIKNEYFQDLNIIQHYKYYFENENYNTIVNDLNNNKIAKIFVNTNYRQIVAIDNLPNSDNLYNHYHISDVNPIVLPNLVEKTSNLHIPIYFVDFTSNTIINFQNILNEIFVISSYTLSILFIITLLSSLSSFFNSTNRPPTMNMKNNKSSNPNSNSNPNSSNNPFGFGFGGLMKNFQKEKGESQYNNPNITLESWAGSPEVIDECKEVISYIENKEKYKQIGAEMPKGILLEGPPGTGKTLLAKAISSETNSTFISMSGSEFVELFVGMGASRVRDLFENARNNKPSIIFIDEIDAVGRQRGSGSNMANDEREQTLNQLLYEMDGFNNNDDIVVIAATNRKDVLDQALLRPGRFDRIIRVPLPDKSSREKIIEYYLKNKNIDKPFDISSIAELTDGFSGAQIKNLINEAAILSVRNNYNTLQEQFVFDSFEKIIVGLIKSNTSVSPATKLRVSIHESGHSLLTLYFNEYFDFKKASIQPTYNGAGGYTLFSEKPEIKESGLYTKDMLKKRLIIAMGGKAAETIYYGNENVSVGAIQDLKQANNLAKRMIGNFGMGDKLEVFFNEDINDNSNPFLGKSLVASNDKYSQRTRCIIDKETLDLVNEAYNKAKDILQQNQDKLIEFAELLQNNTIIYKKDLDKFFIL